jgi:hypothetical protein
LKAAANNSNLMKNQRAKKVKRRPFPSKPKKLHCLTLSFKNGGKKEVGESTKNVFGVNNIIEPETLRTCTSNPWCRSFSLFDILNRNELYGKPQKK